MRFNESNTVEAHLRDALVRLTPTLADRPHRSAEVPYRLRAAITTIGLRRQARIAGRIRYGH